LRLSLVVDLELVVVAVVTVLEWQVVAVVTLLRCSMLTATTSPQVLPSILFVLVLQVDVHAVAAAMVEEVVVSTVAHRLFWVVDSEHSVCKVDHTLVRDVLTAATPA
tara:strand:+ start:858 stop:1178 length:321 start_codon:yes stop_codon:yes gene_type:complete